MDKKNEFRRTSISKASTIEEIGEFWDTHSLADYWDQTHEVELEVRIKRRRRVTLDPEVYAQVEAQARERGITPETLVNLGWLNAYRKQANHTPFQGGILAHHCFSNFTER